MTDFEICLSIEKSLDVQVTNTCIDTDKCTCTCIELLFVLWKVCKLCRLYNMHG